MAENASTLMGFYKEAKQTVDKWLSVIYGGTVESEATPKPKDKQDVANFIQSLLDDSMKWRDRSLRGRFGFDGKMYYDPIEFWKDCRRLEAGDHWQVWGHRKEGETSKDWKHELIEDEIADQIRVKISYLTGNWHSFDIIPNINNLNDILDDERVKTRWTEKIKLAAKTMKIEGTAHALSFLDRSVDDDGVANEIILDNASVFPTPFATGIELNEGCWYMLYATLASIDEMKADPRLVDFDFSDINTLAGENAQKYSLEFYDGEGADTSFANTKFALRIEAWLDDPTLEKAKMTEDEQLRIDSEHGALDQGQELDVEDSDVHLSHIEQHIEYMQNIASQQPQSPEEAQALMSKIQYMQDHIEEHKEEIDEMVEQGIPKGSRLKYPHGRHILVIGGKVGIDEPSPFEFPWRCLWHKVDNETMKGHYWGRGDVEILWNTNYTEDTMLSRIADVAITTAMPKPWFHIDDKQSVEDGWDNDPTKPAFYEKTPPSFRTANAPPELLQIYQAKKQGAGQRLGVTDVTYGNAPTANASGDLVELLIQQNEVQITGEANYNLNEFVRSILSTRLKIMKQFYTEARYFVVDGQVQPINLSRLLSAQAVVDENTGETVMRPIPEFVVQIKAGSNFPLQWERYFGFLTRLATTVMPDGSPLIPREALLDVLAERFPKFGRSGSYYQMSQAMQVGMQAIAQQEAAQREELKTLEMAKNKFQRKGLEELMKGGVPSNALGIDTSGELEGGGQPPEGETGV